MVNNASTYKTRGEGHYSCTLTQFGVQTTYLVVGKEVGLYLFLQLPKTGLLRDGTCCCELNDLPVTLSHLGQVIQQIIPSS